MLFRNQLKKIDIMIYNKIIFAEFYVLALFSGVRFCVLCPGANKSNSKRKLRWQETISLSLKPIFLENNIKFQVYLMSWFALRLPDYHKKIIFSSKFFIYLVQTFLKTFAQKVLFYPQNILMLVVLLFMRDMKSSNFVNVSILCKTKPLLSHIKSFS